jgi:sugar lactone lactonase YvrE
MKRTMRIIQALKKTGFFLMVLALFLSSADTILAQMSVENLGFPFERPGFFSIPTVMTYDAIRNRLAVADKGRNLIYVFNLEDQTFETIGESREFNAPVGLAFNMKGDIFISQNKINFLLVYRFGVNTPESLTITSENSSVRILPGRIYIGMDQNILIADQSKPIIYRVSPDGKLISKITDNLRSPNGLLIKSDSHIIVADRGIDPILIFSKDGEFVRRLAIPEPVSNKKSYTTAGLAIDQSGWLYSLNTTQSKVIWYDPAGVNRAEWSPANQPFFPVDIVIDKFNKIYVLDSGSGKIWVLSNVK